MSWPTTTVDGVDYWVFDGLVYVPVTPEAGAAILMLKPNGTSIAAGFPAIATGDTGPAATFQEGATDIDILDYDDATAAGISIVELSPGVYGLTGALHEGAPGADGTSTVTLTGIDGSSAADKIIRVNSDVDGFEFAYELAGSSQWPATISNTTAGTANSTLAVVSITAKNTDYRVRARGYQIVRESGGSDVVVNLYARLNGETGGNIVAKCQGLGGTERLTLVDANPAGAVDTWNKVTAGNAATVHFRAEQQSGSDDYTTSSTEGVFVVDLLPIR